MSLMDYIQEYTRIKEDSKALLDRLDKEIKALGDVFFDYKSVADSIIDKLERRTNVLISYNLREPRNLRLGDLVLGLRNNNYRFDKIAGLQGKIVHTYLGYCDGYGIEWEKNVKGGDCRGRARRGHGLYLYTVYFKKLEKRNLTDNIGTKKDYMRFINGLAEELIKTDKRYFLNFRKWDKVKLREDSIYYDKCRHHGSARITKIYLPCSYEPFRFRVKFGDDYSRFFLALNLELVNCSKRLGTEKQAKKLVKEIVKQVEVESGLNRYRLRRARLIKKGVAELKEFYYTKSQILDFFKKRFDDVSDVEEALK